MRQLALILLAACNPTSSVPPISEALPRAQDVEIRVPASTKVERTLGATADFYSFTRSISVDLNGGVAFVLMLVHTIVEYPVTTVDGDVYTWGPWQGDGLQPAAYRLVVTDVSTAAAESYTWSLEGRLKSAGDAAAFTPVIAGTAFPGAAIGSGHGSFSADFDAAEALDPAGNDAAGSLAVSYDLRSDPHIWMTAVNPDGTFNYEYLRAADGSGDFQFEMLGDTEDAGTLAETVGVHSRWLAAGAGRADVVAAGGDLGATTVSLVECWDASYGRVYYVDSQTWAPTEGAATACAFSDVAAVDFTTPSF